MQATGQQQTQSTSAQTTTTQTKLSRNELKEKIKMMQDRKQRIKLYNMMCISRDHDLTLTIKHAQSKLNMDVVDNVSTFRALRVKLSREE